MNDQVAIFYHSEIVIWSVDKKYPIFSTGKNGMKSSVHRLMHAVDSKGSLKSIERLIFVHNSVEMINPNSLADLGSNSGEAAIKLPQVLITVIFFAHFENAGHLMTSDGKLVIVSVLESKEVKITTWKTGEKKERLIKNVESPQLRELYPGVTAVLFRNMKSSRNTSKNTLVIIQGENITTYSLNMSFNLDNAVWIDNDRLIGVTSDTSLAVLDLVTKTEFKSIQRGYISIARHNKNVSCTYSFENEDEMIIHSVIQFEIQSLMKIAQDNWSELDYRVISPDALAI